MSVSSGSRFGVYEIQSLIGVGGMGEVYRARDVRLGREVAVKLLRDGEGHPTRRARFDREARALASLNHPNIATMYGVEDSAAPDGASPSSTAIVMELVEGDTLCQRLERGPLPLHEALDVAAQIADALEAAHRKGIVHRDLKPANVKISPSGTVKVLDFGLAKMLSDEAADPAVSQMATAAHVVLGTPAYMAPEQAQGASADAQVDIWAFGVVLYEMVTGQRPFRGESLQETLAAVCGADVNWEPVPAAARPLLRACLERNPRRRLRDIGDYRFVLGTPEVSPRPRRLSALLWAASAAAVTLVILAFLAGRIWRSENNAATPGTPIRVSMMLPEGVSVTRGPGYTSSVAVSPDGATAVVAAVDGNGQRLYRRSLDRLDLTPIAGTEGGTSPFFSWDGKWIGFFSGGHLKRVPAEGGAPIEIADVPGFSSGASWGPDDRIVFAYGADSHLQVVPMQGGRIETLTGQIPGRQPEVLPDGETVLFESAGYIYAYGRRRGAITKLVQGTAPRYLDGYLIFTRGTTLLAAPLNLAALSTGAAFTALEDVAVEVPGSGGGRHYAVSRNGALVYVPGPSAYELVIAVPGSADRVIGRSQRSFENPRFSPDGRDVVVASRRRDDEPPELWLHHLQDGTSTRLTSNGGRAAIWSEGGDTITYSHLGEGQGIYVTRPDVGGNGSQLLALTTFHWLVGWTPDSATLYYGLMGNGNRSSIMSYAQGSSRTVVGPGSAWGGRLSPDGKWLAYYVLDAGTFEVYVTSLPDASARWLVAEGTDPAWGPDGREIYYRSGTRLMAARINAVSGIRVVSTRVVADAFLPPLYDDYDVHRDGRTLVLVRPVNRTLGREVTVVVDWVRDLRRKR